MQAVLDQLTSVLGPQVADMLNERTSLDPDTAQQAVPAVARPILDGLRSKLESPAQNTDALTALYRFMTDASRPAAPEATTPASGSDATLALVEKLTGQSTDGFAERVASTLGVESGTAQTVIRVVAPKVFAFLRSRTQSDEFDGLLKLVLDNPSSAKLQGILALLKGSDGAGSIMKGLGGLFGD
jgi:hypothetical protein